MARSEVIYFSRPGENIYREGRAFLNVGNTEVLAREIADQTHAVLREITPAVAYPGSYDETLVRSKAEREGRVVESGIVQLDGKLPAEAVVGKDIFLGFPIWWNTISAPIAEFLAVVDLADTVIRPFCTHEGSRFGKALADIALLQPAVQIVEGLPVRGSCVTCAAQAVHNWLDGSSER